MKAAASGLAKREGTRPKEGAGGEKCAECGVALARVGGVVFLRIEEELGDEEEALAEVGDAEEEEEEAGLVGLLVGCEEGDEEEEGAQHGQAAAFVTLGQEEVEECENLT
jgi:hypothetical protein